MNERLHHKLYVSSITSLLYIFCAIQIDDDNDLELYEFKLQCAQLREGEQDVLEPYKDVYQVCSEHTYSIIQVFCFHHRCTELSVLGPCQERCSKEMRYRAVVFSACLWQGGEGNNMESVECVFNCKYPPPSSRLVCYTMLFTCAISEQTHPSQSLYVTSSLERERRLYIE